MNTYALHDYRERLSATLSTTIALRRSLSGSMNTIKQRLAHVRDCAGVSQAEMVTWLKAAGLRISLRTWQNYEQGTCEPNSRVLVALFRLGISPAWILTGAGSELVASPRPADALDRERMATAIEATAEGLKNIQRTLPPKLYAQLALAAYDLIGGEC